jgi:16S rRNA (uracil1498-N3)-methyltransferase
MSSRFYTNCSLQPGILYLHGPEAHHLATVCRFRPGDEVCLFNGDGYEYPARVVAIAKKSVELEILEKLNPARELAFRLELAAPLPKGDRAQFLLEKLTELGVTSYVPLSTQRSVIQPREAKLEKLQRHVIEASKQCRRNVLMEVKPVADWESYSQQQADTIKFLAHPGGEPLRAVTGNFSSVVVAVGPEGGFTDEEIAAGVASGWRLVDLGPRILRMETAALMLAGWIGSAS